MVASVSLKEDTTTNPSPVFYFQAVGILKVQVLTPESNKFTIIFNNKEYKLLYPPKQKQLFTFLKKEIERSKSDIKRLILYPQAQHYPERDKPYQIKFCLLGYDGQKEYNKENLISSELEDGEFFLKGFWNFIPVCKTPCISVFKNYSEQRKKELAELDELGQKYFLKPSHLPVLWRDALVPAFRYNPRLPKDKQKDKYFIGIKARFLSERDCFGFKSLLFPPLKKEEAPRFLKAKKDNKKSS